jgi:putative sterol carrier protein
MAQVSDKDPTDARWFKSSYSNGSGACVEVAFRGGTVAIRDSKNPAGAVLTFTPDGWDAFVEGVRGGAFTPAHD